MNPNASAFNPNASSFVPSWTPAPAEPVAEVKKVDPEVLEAEKKRAEEAAAEAAAAEALARQEQMLKELSFHDEREHVNIVFIGHVDSGKSTISGQILCLAGMVEQRLIEKYEREAKENNRESWYLAFVMDINEDERAKGKTVEVGKASFQTAHKRYTILDAPGHKSYVPNMISGASQADVGVLVISARKGEFETGFDRGGQTREHAMLAKTLGVSKLIVVVNKMDEETVQWSEERFAKIMDKLNPFLKGCGFNTKKHVQYIPISGFTGANIKDRVASDVCSWYKGPSLFEALDSLPSIKRSASGPVRLPIMGKYKDKGFTYLLGKVECGTLVAGSEMVLMPTNDVVQVSEVLVDDEAVECAKPGENLCVATKSIDENLVHPGFVLCDKDNLCQTATVFDAKLVVMELLEHKPLITKGYSAILHIHSLSIECEITSLLIEFSKKTGLPEKKHPKFVKEGSVVAARISVEQSICLETFAERPQLGRFTLRDEGKTIAIGKVVKIPQLKQ